MTMAIQKFDDETSARALRMYDDRLKQCGISQTGARREIGELLRVKQEAIRGWLRRERDIEDRVSFFRVGGARPQTRTIIDYEREHEDRFGVEPILAVLNEHGIGIAPSTDYAAAARGLGPSARDLHDAYAANVLFDLWLRNRSLCGRRKLWKAALRAGMKFGRDQVARLVKLVGINGDRHAPAAVL